MVKSLSTANVVIYDISGDADSVPESLPRPPFIPRESIVLVTGEAPSWRYGMALSYLRKCPASVIAFRDSETSLFRVVLSGDPHYPEGTSIKI